MRPALASSVLALGLTLLAACADAEPESLACAAPDEAIPGPVVSSVGTGAQAFESPCTLLGLSLVEGRAQIELDCQELPLSIEVPTTRLPALVGALNVEIDSSGERFELRLRDEVGVALIVLSGVINPGSEAPLSWQLEHGCGAPSGRVAAHLVVREPSGVQELRVDVGEVEEIEAEDPFKLGDTLRFELRTYMARFELGPEGDVGYGSVAMIRLN